MSKQLGFTPTDSPFYFFLSYNGDDYERVGVLARALSRLGIPIWYDDGIELGEDWEKAIHDHIVGSQAFLLFFTKGILEKENCYVKDEYDLAKKDPNKRVCIIYLDDIFSSSIPESKKEWVNQMRKLQGVEGYRESDTLKLAESIAAKLSFLSKDQRQKRYLEVYEDYFIKGDREAASQMLSLLFEGKQLEAKASVVYHLIHNGFQEARLSPIGEKVKDEKKLRGIYDCVRFNRGNISYAYGSHLLGARDDYNEVAVFYTNDEISFHVGPCPEIKKMEAYCDALDDVIYIYLDHTSAEDTFASNPRTLFSIIAIESSSENPKYHRYDFAK